MNFRKYLLILVAVLGMVACQREKRESNEGEFVTVRDGKFFIGDKEYRYIGANFWYGAILGSEGRGGNRERLIKELDLLKSYGITNLRVLVGGEGLSERSDHIRPTLQPEPGVYNDTLLVGLDFLMAEMEKRDMKAILYLHNSWQWSGGYGTYLEWAGCGESAPATDWYAYLDYHRHFVTNDSARAMALRHTRFIVGRTNTITGKPYSESPALMSWEVANEPRAFATDSLTKDALVSWVKETSEAIKAIDPNHLVTTGSEGLEGCEYDIDLFERIHALPSIDYLCVHIWPFNWHWLGPGSGTTAVGKEKNGPQSVTDSLASSIRNTQDYINRHMDVVRRLGKPIVLEEFGYPRDNYEIAAASPTSARDRYYEFMLSQVSDSLTFNGCNFWAWAGIADVREPYWHEWADYTGDPAQEEQGLYSIFNADLTTISVILEKIKKLGQ